MTARLTAIYREIYILRRIREGCTRAQAIRELDSE